jgi:polysaccharide biosynthesis/export protein
MGMIHFARLASRGCLLLLVSAWAYNSTVLAQQAPADTQANTTAAPPAAAAPAPDAPDAGVAPSSYVIGAGDVLHVSVWDEPQLTVTATVRPDGNISMPLIYDVSVSGTTPDELQKSLTEKLTRFVHKPRVTVTVQEIHSRMVFITGEVQRPGAYPLVAPMNVVQLIARSGGLTDFAKQKKIYVLRANKTTRLDVNYEKVLRGQAPTQNVDLAPGDTVVVP